MKIFICVVIGFVLVVSVLFVFVDLKVEIVLMKKVFVEIQFLLFKCNCEYCGYIGYDFDGNLVVFEVWWGWKFSCCLRDLVEIEVIIVFYYIYGVYNNDEGFEVLSVEDMEGDEVEGIDGYVVMSGGCMWYVDIEVMEISQICGVGCLDQDFDFECYDVIIENSYFYDELVEWFEGDGQCLILNFVKFVGVVGWYCMLCIMVVSGFVYIFEIIWLIVLGVFCRCVRIVLFWLFMIYFVSFKVLEWVLVQV